MREGAWRAGLRSDLRSYPCCGHNPTWPGIRPSRWPGPADHRQIHSCPAPLPQAHLPLCHPGQPPLSRGPSGLVGRAWQPQLWSPSPPAPCGAPAVGATLSYRCPGPHSNPSAHRAGNNQESGVQGHRAIYRLPNPFKPSSGAWVSA